MYSLPWFHRFLMCLVSAQSGGYSHLRSCLLLSTIFMIVILIQACGTPSMNPSAAQIVNEKSTLYDSEIIRAQNAHLINSPVTVVAPVVRILDEDNLGQSHQKFLIQLSNGTTVLVAHNTRMAPRVPIKVSDLVTIHGDFVWNQKGGVIHWTHHSNSAKHQGGWIQYRGQIYQ
jgi:hypothetical protein